MSLSSPYQDPALCRALLDRLQTALDGRELRFMEVCGTHTVSIFQSGLRSLLPKEVTHLSGPGCPVCVTHDAEVAAFLDLAGRDVIAQLRAFAPDSPLLWAAPAAAASSTPRPRGPASRSSTLRWTP